MDSLRSSGTSAIESWNIRAVNGRVCSCVRVLEVLLDHEVSARLLLVVLCVANCVVKEVFELNNSLIDSTLSVETGLEILDCVFLCEKVAQVVGGSEEPVDFVLT